MNVNGWSCAVIGWLASGGLVCALAAAPDSPAPAAPVPDFPALRHTVAAGDTLESLAQRYTGQRANWRALQRFNRVADSHHLRLGQVIVIPPALRSPAPTVARVAYVHGSASAEIPGAAAPVALSDGMALPESSRVRVADSGYVRLVFADGSTTDLPEGTQIVLERLRQQPVSGVRQTDLRIESGRADSTVTPLKSPQSQFRIRTPLAVASVRGTRFGVEFRPDAQTASSEVLEGRVQVAGTAGMAGAAANAAGATAGGSRVSTRDVVAGLGTRVGRDGRVPAPWPLPPAPDLAGLPAVLTEADAVILPLPPIPQADVTGYRVRMATGTDRAAIVADRIVAVASGSATLPAQPDGDYQLGLRAIDAQGLQGPEAWRAVRIKAHPLPPLFRSPEPGDKVRGDQVTLRCIAPDQAWRVRLQIAATPTFDAPLIEENDVQDCSYTATLPPGKYYWRLATVEQRADQSLDEGPYSRPQSFDLAPLPPTPQQLELTRAPDRLQAHWAGLPGLVYHVQVATDAAFTQPIYDDRIAGSEVRVDGLAPGQYFLRMQAIDTDGVAGPFGTAWRMQVGENWTTGSGQPLIGGDAPVVQGGQ